jgi:transcriptional regulator with XRE-family HTH domain
VPVPPSYADGAQRQFFVAWLNEKLAASGLSKTQVAAALGHDTTQQLNKFLRGIALPMPDTLRTLCDRIGVSWTEGYANAGYYGEILGILALLGSLAMQWLKEDEALSDQAAFVNFGVVSIAGIPVRDALQEPRYRARYTIGSWEEGPFAPQDDAVYADMEPQAAAFFKELDRREAESPRTVTCVVPKPLALAILVAVAGFPRRGDTYKSGANMYAANVFSSATTLIELAERSVGNRLSLPPLLRRANDALKGREMLFGLRRVIAAEFAVSWADKQCGRFTHIARLAALEYFGVAGSSMDNQSPEVYWPQIRRANLPPVSEFSELEEAQSN